MELDRRRVGGVVLSVGSIFLVVSAVAWTPLPVEDDELLFMPGSQPGAVGNFEAPSKCENCHGDYDPAVEPGQAQDRLL